MKQTPQTALTQSRTVQMGSKISPKISTIRSQVLGPIKRSFKTLNQSKHYKTLKKKCHESILSKLISHETSRPQSFVTNVFCQNITKKSVISSRIKLISHEIYQNSNFLVSTRRSHRVDQLCLQSRRKPTIRFS